MDVLHFILHKGVCSKCGKVVKAEIPSEHQTGYGPRLSALIAEISGIQGNSRETVRTFCRSVLNFPISTGAEVLSRFSLPAEKSDDGVAKIIYTAKDGKSQKMFNALDWLARLVTHIPGRYEHTVRYYGYFSNKSRGMRKKAETDNTIPTIMQNKMSSKEARQNWARLIQKIYEYDFSVSRIPAVEYWN